MDLEYFVGTKYFGNADICGTSKNYFLSNIRSTSGGASGWGGRFSDSNPKGRSW